MGWRQKYKQQMCINISLCWVTLLKSWYFAYLHFFVFHCLHHNSCHTLRCSLEEQLGAWILEPPYWVKPQLCTLACSLHPIIKPLWTLSLHLWNSADNSTCLMQSWGLHKALRLCLECRLSLFWSSSPSRIYRENNMKLRRPCTKQSKFFFY